MASLCGYSVAAQKTLITMHSGYSQV